MRIEWHDRAFEMVESIEQDERVACRSYDGITRENVELFWSLVSKTDGCWLWSGSRTPAGYGVIQTFGGLRYAHRFAIEMRLGPLGKLCACHHCDNPPCVRFDHLFPGTHKDNTVDMLAKGRGRCPVPATVIQAGAQTLTLAQWSQQTGVSVSVIRARIRYGWKPERAVTERLNPVGFQPLTAGTRRNKQQQSERAQEHLAQGALSAGKRQS